MILREWDPKGIEGRIVHLQRLLKQSIRDPLVSRQLALSITHGCPWRDDRCELAAIWHFMHRNIRYTGDIAGYDTFQTARRTLQFRGGDCIPQSARVLRSDYQLVPLAEVAPGTEIADRGGWTSVEEIWFTGVKRLFDFELDNGCVLRCSAEHRIFRAPSKDSLGAVEIRASEARPGDYLTTLDQISTVAHEGFPQTEDEAWLLGVFIADGWVEGGESSRRPRPYRFAISGQDGKPKEAQKERVRLMMEARGIATRHNRKYISVSDPDLAAIMASCGRHAPNKRVPALALKENLVRALLEGLRADAAVTKYGTVTYGTTSQELALQLRVLYRMIGQSVHIRRVDKHGGFGVHPIYRITVRQNNERRNPRIVGIRTGSQELCMDLTTKSGNFWLPESDVVVHNCDDGFGLSSTLAMGNGFPAKGRITKNYPGGPFAHIYPLIGFPKNNPKQWVPLDWTLGYNRFGAHPPQANFVEFDGFQISHGKEISHAAYQGW